MREIFHVCYSGRDRGAKYGEAAYGSRGRGAICGDDTHDSIGNIGGPRQGKGRQIWGGCIWEGEGVSYGRQSTQVHLYKGDLDQTLIRDLRCIVARSPRRTVAALRFGPREARMCESGVTFGVTFEIVSAKNYRCHARSAQRGCRNPARASRSPSGLFADMRGRFEAFCTLAAFERRLRDGHKAQEEKVRGGEAGQTREQACEGKAGQRREQVCEGRGGQGQRGGGGGKEAHTDEGAHAGGKNAGQHSPKAVTDRSWSAATPLLFSTSCPRQFSAPLCTLQIRCVWPLGKGDASVSSP